MKKVQKNKIYGFLYIILFLFVHSLPAQSDTIYVLNNLNGAITDCKCNNTENGSYARVISFYEKNKKAIYILNGDFLTSYEFSDYNRWILNLILKGPFSIVLPGEQEFIHTVFKEEAKKNIYLKNKLLFPAIDNNIKSKKINLSNGKKILLFHLWDNNILYDKNIEYDTIDLNSIFKKIKPLKKPNVFIFIFYHGNYDQAIHFYRTEKWIDGIVVGHEWENKKILSYKKQRFLIGGGKEAEQLIQIIYSKQNEQFDHFDVKLIDLIPFFREHKNIIKMYKEFELRMRDRR